jgi:hypothetical protein
MADRAWLSPLFDAWKRFRPPLASAICFQCFERDFGRFQNVTSRSKVACSHENVITNLVVPWCPRGAWLFLSIAIQRSRHRRVSFMDLQKIGQHGVRIAFEGENLLARGGDVCG